MALAHVSIAMPFYAVPALSVQIQYELSIDHGQFGWLVSAWAAGGFLVSALAGPINRRSSARTLLLIANVASLLLLGIGLGRLDTFEMSLLVLALAGISYSLVTPATSGALASTISHGSWATGMGLKQTGVPLGGALGAVGAGVLEPALGWQQALLVVSVAGFIIGAIAWIAFPVSSRGAVDRSSPRLRSSRDAIPAYGLCLVLAWASAAVTAYLASYLVSEVGLSLSLAAWILGSALFAGAIGRIGWGVLGDAVGPARRGLVLLGPLMLGGVGLIMLARTGPDPQAALFIALLVGGATTGWAGVQSALVVDLVGTEAAAGAAGINAAVAYAGVFLGPIFVAMLADLLGSFSAAWMVAALVLLLSSPLVLVAARAPSSRERWTGSEI
jgi:predicted MFS family arabinose efflux permease